MPLSEAQLDRVFEQLERCAIAGERCPPNAREGMKGLPSNATDNLSDQGRIKEGNSADFVVCDGDPLADIKRAARKENHRLVVKRGQVAKDRRTDFANAVQRVAAE